MVSKTLAKSTSPSILRPMGISTLPRFHRARLIAIAKAKAKADLVVEARPIPRSYALSIILILAGG